VDREHAERYRNDFLKLLAQTIPGRKELVVERATGCTIWDAEGRSYLDLTSGIAVANVGHAHPAVVAAVRDAVGRMTHVNVYGRFVVPAQVDLARKLAALLPSPLTQTFLCNSGAEAVEGALKLARKFTGRAGIVAFEGGFHGRTMGALSVTWKPAYRAPFEPLLPGVRFVPFGDPDAACEAIDGGVGAVIIEPVQGEAGVRPAPTGFLQRVRERCDEVGALLIFDEVQGGFGRTGRWFSFEHHDVAPDIVVMAKALGGGLPLGAFTAAPEHMATFLDPPLTHLTTFGGNPVSCAAALAAIDVIQRERLVERADVAGALLGELLEQLLGSRIGVSAYRRTGLWAGIDLERPELARNVVAACQDRGVLVGSMLHAEGTIRISPPLVISDDELRHGIQVLREAIHEVMLG
jgi:predicted acetylornithine/succinylornithine family transaminase